jgi:ABC-type multidrug transport system fused ATPase/permease subunit
MEDITGRLVEYVGGFRDIVAAGRFRVFAGRFDDLLRQSEWTNVRTAVWGQAAGLVPMLLVSLAMLGVYWFGLRRADSVADVGEFITYAGFVSQLFPALMAVAQASTELAMAMPSLESLRQVLDQPPLTARPDAAPLEGVIRAIAFDRVGLDLEGRPVVRDMSFSIPSGKLTAIVGQSGAGKTTLFHLMLRLIEPTSGRILINDRPVECYTLDSLRAQVGFIPQNPFIFNDTLRENILLASPEATPAEKLNRALELAQLQEVVALRKEQGGLEAVAGYMGSRLSGGEKQRVALARLVLRDPQVIVCDEYTANVDARTAHLIQEAMRIHFAGRTRVVITHELYNARGADWIIVIDHGRVVQQGTHEELRGQPGLYRELLDVQTI